MKKKKTTDTLYLNLQHSFTRIRSLFLDNTPPKNQLDYILGDLRFARKQIEKYAKRRPRKILIYCTVGNDDTSPRKNERAYCGRSSNIFLF